MRIDIIAVLLKSFIRRNDIIFHQTDTPIEKYYDLRDEILDHCVNVDDDELLDIMDYILERPNLVETLFR